MAHKDPRAEAIERLIDQHRRSVTWVAKRLGKNKQTVLNWLRGENVPRDEAVWDEMLALFPKAPLDVREPTQRLYGGVGEAQFAVSGEDVDIPLWPALPADENWGELSDVTDFLAVPYFLSRRPRRPGEAKAPDRYAAPISGDSMAPRLLPGDLIVFEADPRPRPGRIIVARAGSSATVKVLRSDHQGNLVLESINKERGPVAPLNSEIVGFVVAILRNYTQGRGSIEWDDGGLGA